MRALHYGKGRRAARRPVVSLRLLPVIGIPACAAFLTCAGCAKHYRVEGIVLRVEPSRREMVVSHRAIEGYMPAMAMPFHAARASDVEGLAPGTRVTFDLAVGRRSAVARHVRKVAIDDGVPVAAKPRAITVGEAVPDFALMDERGQSVRLADYRGRVVAIDFIYTRCPLPDVCPRLSVNFAALQKWVPALSLLSVTIDPEFDRPEVLAAYARRYEADPARWRFLTGTPEEIRQVAASFGLLFWNEESMIAHTAATAVIDRQGRLVGIIEGASYRWEQLRDLAAVAMQ